MSEDKHLGLFSRPSVKGQWIVPSAQEIQLWVLQSFTGVGPAIADKIVEKFGGIPMQWTCTLEELSAITRLTKANARIMYETLKGKPASTEGLTIAERIARLKSG